MQTFANYCAHGINPLLLGLFIVIPFTPLNASSNYKKLSGLAVYFAAGIIAMGFASLLAELGKLHVVWPGKPWFPSGHQTLATTIAACIWVIAPNRLRPILILPVLLMSFGVVYLKWHEPIDAAGGIALGITVTIGLYWVAGRWINRPNAPSAS